MTEYLFEVRMERVPSWELIVFCRFKGMPDEVAEPEDARDGVCSIEAAMLLLCRLSGEIYVARGVAQLRSLLGVVSEEGGRPR